MDTRELLKTIRQLEIATRRAVRSQLAGGYHSVFKGRGMVVSDLRPYQTGDDWRAVNWNVTARTGELYVKEFVEERELIVMLLVDISASLDFASRGLSKRELAAKLAALIAFSAIRNRDKVGLCLFSDEVELYLPPKKGRPHGLRIIREVLGHQAKSHGSRLDKALQYVARVVHGHTVAFVVSDFLHPPQHEQSLDRALRVAAIRHDLVAIEVSDPFERILPKAGLLQLRDVETGRMITLDSDDAMLRQSYAAQQQQRLDRTRERLTRLGIDHLFVSTDADPVVPLVQFFARRQQRRGRGAA